MEYIFPLRIPETPTAAPVKPTDGHSKRQAKRSIIADLEGPRSNMCT